MWCYKFLLLQSQSEVAQSCPTLCDPMDCSPPGSSVHGVFQARTLEWVATSFSRGSSWLRGWTQVSSFLATIHYCVLLVPLCMLSCFSLVQLFATPWTVTRQSPLSVGFPRQEYWSGLPSLLSGDLPDPRIELASHASPALTGRFFTTSATWESCSSCKPPQNVCARGRWTRKKKKERERGKAYREKDSLAEKLISVL